jgi:hypothetical protein
LQHFADAQVLTASLLLHRHTCSKTNSLCVDAYSFKKNFHKFTSGDFAAFDSDVSKP